MKSQALKRFLQALAADPAFKAQCGAVRDLRQLEALAHAVGFAIKHQGAAALGSRRGLLGALVALGQWR